MSVSCRYRETNRWWFWLPFHTRPLIVVHETGPNTEKMPLPQQLRKKLKKKIKWKMVVKIFVTHLPNILITLVWPLTARPNSVPRLLAPCNNLLFLNLNPISTYSTQISVIGPTKNRKLETSNACSTRTFFTCANKCPK